MESLKLFKYSRTSTLILLEQLDEDAWNYQPEGWPNNVRWLAGHIYAEAEGFMHDADHDYVIEKPDWLPLFLDGSRPSEWKETDNVPSRDEILAALKDQEKAIEAFFAVQPTKRPVSKIRDLNGMLLETVESSMQFITWHEGIHIGDIKGLRLLWRNK